MLTTSEQINEIAAALAKAQGAMDNASKDRTNPAFKSKYADLASVRDAVNEPLSKAGIAYVQAAQTTADGVSVETRLIHTSGQWFACTVGAVPKAYDPQSIGSAITYLRRYGLMSMAGIAPEDDDGNVASGRSEAPRWQERPDYRHEEPRASEAPRTPRERAIASGEAPAEWTEAQRKGFCAELGKLGMKYPVVAGYVESLGRPRPSAMTAEQRSGLLQHLLGNGRAAFDAYASTFSPPDSQ